MIKSKSCKQSYETGNWNFYYEYCSKSQKNNIFLTEFHFRNTSRSDFKFYADRLIRLVIEESLNQLPYSDCSVVTPTGAIYDGLK